MTHEVINLSNRLQYETSPYLIQHKDNPVDWYPWCKEAFRRAKADDKPIFLSIGYSSCHWCHVMAHESFEDQEIADLLNKYFISIKVDREERPDIDSVYMSVCQAFTGSGGWPTSIFMTADQKPFFAGTYFPKNGRDGMMGLKELLIAIHEMWTTNRHELLRESEEIIKHLNKSDTKFEAADIQILDSAVALYERIYDRKYGGFGKAPKFTTPHNIIFLLSYYERFGKVECLEMAEHTLLQMYRGGMFDHVGFGFCRYSTDARFLVPHFEKMLYDNALLILAYCKAYAVTKKTLYLKIAEKTADYILREMTAPDGGFYSAQDADSDGEEGKYYLFTHDEIISVLGKLDGEAFNRHFDISDKGNFEGKSILNILNSDWTDESFETLLPQIYNYRKERNALHLDDKILTAWNGLMIAAMCELYRAGGKSVYIESAKNADAFILKNLYENGILFVSFKDGKNGVEGFLDDYAGFIFAQLSLYQATLEQEYLERAKLMCENVLKKFSDDAGGFYLYSNDSETLIVRPKETYDGAIPSGNSLMAYNLVRLSLITSDESYASMVERQLNYIAADASHYPPGYAMFLTALLEYSYPPTKVTVVLDDQTDKNDIPIGFSTDTIVTLLKQPTEEYPLKNAKTTFYVCHEHSCMPPVNNLNELM
ncbi:MAG: thioredoxin domain-containing protein [Christensenellaceae bacterium]|nr:thioredoxin domain-containing protein [Christensenellaceae bacterium]